MALRALSLIVLATMLSAPAAMAQSGGGFSAGVIARAGTSPYIGADSETAILPFIAWEGERLSVGLNGISYTVYEQNGMSVAILASPRFDPIDDDNGALDGIDRDFTLDFGARLGLDTATGLEFTATMLQEITGEHDGQEVDLRASYALGTLPLSLYAGATWQSSDLTGYLYGVRPGEAIAGRPAYDPDASITPYLGVSGFLPVSQSTAIIGSIEVQRFGDEITDSPIVDEDGAVSATVGISFRF